MSPVVSPNGTTTEAAASLIAQLHSQLLRNAKIEKFNTKKKF
jgi:hypothetical protein